MISLEAIRGGELARVRSWFRSGDRVLELGDGSGYQASLIAAWNCQVVSVDVPGRPVLPRTYYPVLEYNGRLLPFADATFDVVFSSNVLEHIADRGSVLQETRRVMKTDGRAIHIVPSASWRAWTSLARLAHPLLRRSRSDATASAGESNAVGAPSSFAVRLLLGPPHGEYRSTAEEYVRYRRAEWRRLFETAGFVVVDETRMALFYSGYTLFPGVSLAARRRLASVLGSSCHAFLLSQDSRA